jgi:hypothetical protein
VAGETFDETFNAPSNTVFTAAVEAAACLGYTTLEARPEAGILSFNTGFSMKSFAGQDMTATMLDEGSGKTLVSLDGELARRGALSSGQWFDMWGEKKSVALKFLAQLRECVDRRTRTPLDPLAAETDEGWHPDSSGRHPDRWWDGAAWTRWVRDKPGGTRSEDPPYV